LSLRRRVLFFILACYFEAHFFLVLPAIHLASPFPLRSVAHPSPPPNFFQCILYFFIICMGSPRVPTHPPFPLLLFAFLSWPSCPFPYTLPPFLPLFFRDFFAATWAYLQRISRWSASDGPYALLLLFGLLRLSALRFIISFFHSRIPVFLPSTLLSTLRLRSPCFHSPPFYMFYAVHAPHHPSCSSPLPLHSPPFPPIFKFPAILLRVLRVPMYSLFPIHAHPPHPVPPF